jgi:hypothetical protein
VLLHLDITQDAPFIESTDTFEAFFSHQGIRLLNVRTRDIRKRTVVAFCAANGLGTLGASHGGPDDELLIVKTDLNSAGQREQVLTAEQRQRYHLPLSPGRITKPSGYFVTRRAELEAEVWNDPELVVQRYVQNSQHRFFRVYTAGHAVVISQGHLDKNIRRMEEGIRRYNYRMWREGEKLLGDESPVPNELLRMVGIVLNRFPLDFGAVDFVEDGAGTFFLVDVNKTPFWGAERQPGLLEHLRAGLGGVGSV